jgi:hypothetical protein
MLDFLRIGANVVIFLTIWQLVKLWILRRNPNSDLAAAMAFIVAG